MSKILGKKETIDYARSAAGSTKDVHVNWDAIDQLPEEYEVVITEIGYDPKKIDDSFYDIGNGKGPYLPKPELMYAIAEARGIKGSGESINISIFDEVDYSKVTAPGQIGAPADLRKIKVGHKVAKTSTVLTEDGTERQSSVCTVFYNVWDRCLELWTKEEKYTIGYTKTGRYDNKYQTPYDREAHLAAEMKFAGAKAETKAHEKTIRELAGLMTGYQKTDLTSGRLVFSRVQRSRAVLKMETAARLTAIASGSDSPAKATEALFGPEAGQAALPPAEPPTFEIEEEAPPPPPARPFELVRDSLATYLGEGYIKEEAAVKTVTGIIHWIEKDGDAAENSPKWADAVTWLHYIEDTFVPTGKAIDHGLPRP